MKKKLIEDIKVLTTSMFHDILQDKIKFPNNVMLNVVVI